MSLLGHDDVTVYFNQCRSYPYLGMILKGRKRGLGECEIVLIFRAKHENEAGAQRSEKTACQAKTTILLFT